jgi:hypothetical protein
MAGENPVRKLTVMLAGIAVLAAGVTAVADDDDDHDHDRRRGRSAAVMPPDPVYVKECGSCHLAYPARLLPARSWQRLLGELNDHFGDNAELGPDERTAVGHYLVGNAADSSWNRSPKVMQSLRPEEIPLRVTETGYFKRKHREIPARAINANPGVVSLAQCQACHPRAEAGSYNEHDVAIPGIGRWERN